MNQQVTVTMQATKTAPRDSRVMLAFIWMVLKSRGLVNKDCIFANKSMQRKWEIQVDGFVGLL